MITLIAVPWENSSVFFIASADLSTIKNLLDYQKFLIMVHPTLLYIGKYTEKQGEQFFNSGYYNDKWKEIWSYAMKELFFKGFIPIIGHYDIVKEETKFFIDLSTPNNYLPILEKQIQNQYVMSLQESGYNEENIPFLRDWIWPQPVPVIQENPMKSQAIFSKKNIPIYVISGDYSKSPVMSETILTGLLKSIPEIQIVEPIGRFYPKAEFFITAEETEKEKENWISVQNFLAMKIKFENRIISVPFYWNRFLAKKFIEYDSMQPFDIYAFDFDKTITGIHIFDQLRVGGQSSEKRVEILENYYGENKEKLEKDFKDFEFFQQLLIQLKLNNKTIVIISRNYFNVILWFFEKTNLDQYISKKVIEGEQKYEIYDRDFFKTYPKKFNEKLEIFIELIIKEENKKGILFDDEWANVSPIKRTSFSNIAGLFTANDGISKLLAVKMISGKIEKCGMKPSDPPSPCFFYPKEI